MTPDSTRRIWRGRALLLAAVVLAVWAPHAFRSLILADPNGTVFALLVAQIWPVAAGWLIGDRNPNRVSAAARQPWGRWILIQTSLAAAVGLGIGLTGIPWLQGVRTPTYVYITRQQGLTALVVLIVMVELASTTALLWGSVLRMIGRKPNGRVLARVGATVWLATVFMAAVWGRAYIISMTHVLTWTVTGDLAGLLTPPHWVLPWRHLIPGVGLELVALASGYVMYRVMTSASGG